MTHITNPERKFKMNITDAPHLQLNHILDAITELNKYDTLLLEIGKTSDKLYKELDELPTNKKPYALDGVYTTQEAQELAPFHLFKTGLRRMAVMTDKELNKSFVGVPLAISKMKEQTQAVRQYNQMLETRKMLRHEIGEQLRGLLVQMDKLTAEDLDKYGLNDYQFIMIQDITEQLAKDFK